MVFSQHASNSPLIMHFIWTIMPMFNFKDHFSKNSQRVFGSWEKHNVPPAVTDATTLLWSWFSLDMGDNYCHYHGHDPLLHMSPLPSLICRCPLPDIFCTDLCFQDPFFLEKTIICCEQDWDQEYFEIHEFGTKDSYIFKVSFTWAHSKKVWVYLIIFSIRKVSFKYLVSNQDFTFMHIFSPVP